MKNLAGWVVVACCVLILGAARVETAGADKTLQVREQLTPLLDELQAAANAHDTDRFMALYARQADLVAVFNGTEIRGWDDLHAQQLKWWNHGKSDAVYAQNAAPETLVLGPDVAMVTLLLGSTRTGADGTPVKNEFAISMVWKKFVQGGWKMVYSHESTVH